MPYSLEEAKLKSDFYKNQLDSDLIEHELDHIFVGYTNQKPDINPAEVCDYRYISTEGLKEEIKTNPEIFSEWFKLLFERIHKEIKV